MAFKKSDKPFWKGEPKVIFDFQKGSKTCKALLGKTSDGKYCAALQTFWTDKEGNENPGKGYFIVEEDKADVLGTLTDSIAALEMLKDELEDM